MTGPTDLTGRARLWPRPELGRWRRAAVRALADVDPSLRPPTGGDPMLREELGRLLGVSPDRIVVTAGVRAAAGLLLAPGTEVVVERPTFSGVPAALATAGHRVRSAEWEALARYAGRDTALWFTAPCRNPDGRIADGPFLAALAEAARAGRRVVCNGAYRWFGRPPRLPPDIVQVGTLHKLAGPGAQLGWVTGDLPSATTRALSLAAPPLHWQRTWGYFLADGGIELLLAAHRELAAARAAFLTAAGRDPVPGRDPAGEGPNILLPVPGPEDEVVDRLARAGILVSPGSAFDASGPAVRVCLTGVAPDIAAGAGAVFGALSGVRRAAPAVPSPVRAAPGARGGPG